MTVRWLAIAPGRVNLIGEHTDYNGLPVLPMALDRDVRIDFEILDTPVVALSSPVAGLESVSFSLEGPVERAPQGHWSNYVRAAAQGLADHGLELTSGVRGTVVGTVPQAAGLSSSSALVVASGLALLHANSVTIEPLDLAPLLARSERFVGLEGGGMDQTVCLAGRSGHAVRIDFHPTRVRHVPVPTGWRWVVAHSLQRAEKSGAAMAAYNARARESLEALQNVAPVFGLSNGEGYQRLLSLAAPLALVERARPILDPTLLRRFRHIVTEGARVDQAQEALEAEEHAAFGRLMNGSHESLKEDFDVSTPALDRMVDIALEAGASGARLTGAGFGGCMVALCDDWSQGAVAGALREGYYRPRSVEDLDDVMFEARAAEGARVVRADVEA